MKLTLLLSREASSEPLFDVRETKINRSDEGRKSSAKEKLNRERGVGSGDSLK